MDLGNLLAQRTRRLALLVALALGVCLAGLAVYNTMAQQRQNQDFITTSGLLALQLIRDQPQMTPEQLQHAITERLSKDSDRLTLGHELRENALSTAISFIAFVLFVGLLIALQKRSISLALAPVQHMVQNIEAFESGDLDRRLPAVALRELDTVSKSFNHLADSLQAAMMSQETLSKQLIELRGVERLTLARDLHDDLGQTLTAAAIEIDMAHLRQTRPPSTKPEAPDGLAAIAQRVDQARQALRQLTRRLRGEEIVEPPCDVGALIQSWKVQHPLVRWHLRIEFLAHVEALPKAAQELTYRVLQESLTNVFKHSEAQHCNLEIEVRENHLLALTVENDGVVHNHERPLAKDFRTGVGIHGMQERAEGSGYTVRAGKTSPTHWCVELRLQPKREA
jgi:two-component system, NarL family, sensor histidine kinase UhpB